MRKKLIASLVTLGVIGITSQAMAFNANIFTKIKTDPGYGYEYCKLYTGGNFVPVNGAVPNPGQDLIVLTMNGQKNLSSKDNNIAYYEIQPKLVAMYSDCPNSGFELPPSCVKIKDGQNLTITGYMNNKGINFSCSVK